MRSDSPRGLTRDEGQEVTAPAAASSRYWISSALEEHMKVAFGWRAKRARARKRGRACRETLAVDDGDQCGRAAPISIVEWDQPWMRSCCILYVSTAPRRGAQTSTEAAF